jgi:hypothetical protein
MYIYIFFLHAHPKKWQNNQRIDAGRILVEVEVENYDLDFLQLKSKTVKPV